MLDERFSVPDFDLEDDEVPTTICARCKEEYDIAEIECPSCGLARIGREGVEAVEQSVQSDLRFARRVPCTCGQDDGLHEWDCAISRAIR